MKSTVVDGRSVALTRCGGQLGALENCCPHQGGPVGEGSIEGGWLRCPWHGYDYDPITCQPPEDFTDAVAAAGVEERDDGAYVNLPAWTAEAGCPVVAFTGDGGFAQYAMELNSAVNYAIPIKHLPLNNNALAKIEREQVVGDLPVWQTSLSNPDWAAYAELCGATGIRVTTRDQLHAALRRMFENPGPVLVCVEQDAALL